MCKLLIVANHMEISIYLSKHYSWYSPIKIEAEHPRISVSCQSPPYSIAKREQHPTDLPVVSYKNTAKRIYEWKKNHAATSEAIKNVCTASHFRHRPFGIGTVLNAEEERVLVELHSEVNASEPNR
jgi:hypothetical protein